VKYPKKSLEVVIYQIPNGKIEQYLVVDQ